MSKLVIFISHSLNHVVLAVSVFIYHLVCLFFPRSIRKAYFFTPSNPTFIVLLAVSFSETSKSICSLNTQSADFDGRGNNWQLYSVFIHLPILLICVCIFYQSSYCLLMDFLEIGSTLEDNK